MADPKLDELRRVVGQHEKTIYEIVKAGGLDELPHEDQLIGRAMQEHMHLKHIHNALEFADLREGEPYEVMFNGEPVSPLAHVATHSAVKGQIAEDPLVRAAFEKMVATGCSAHHAEHVLGAMFTELWWSLNQTGPVAEKAMAVYRRKLKKINWDSAFRKKLTRQFGPDHSAFE